MGQGDTLQNASIGAVATTVFYFIPVIQAVAPIAGGTVAGYLQKQGAGSGMKVGGIKGIVMTIPAILIAIVAGGMLADMPVIGELLAGSVAIIVIIVVVHSVAFGLIGGLFGGLLSGS